MKTHSMLPILFVLCSKIHSAPSVEEDLTLTTKEFVPILVLYVEPMITSMESA